VLVPAATVAAVLDGLERLGLDADRLAREVGASRTERPLDGRLPKKIWDDLVTCAQRDRPTPTLAVELGLACPFGAFGVMDYLVASSATVRGGLASLAAHFDALAAAVRMEIEPAPVGAWISFNGRAGASEWAREFSLSVVVGRVRSRTARRLEVRQVELTRPQGPPEFAQLLEAPVRFGAHRVALRLDDHALDLEPDTADPRLHAALSDVVRTTVGASGSSSLELAIRTRLHDLLPSGSGDAASVARLLGVSERTLARRLADEGTSFRKVLEAYRAEEGPRRLAQNVHSLAQIAADLGYNDQSAWTKAFRRQHGVTPAAWRRRHR
jgi:AraC-like DNA-binding protein